MMAEVKIPKTMRAFAAVSPGKTQVIRMDVPTPGEHQALIQMECCVPCNTTDRYIIQSSFGTQEFPVLVGHESVGRVVAVGTGVRHLKVGDRVVRANATGVPFRDGYYSKWGGFAEYGLVEDGPPVAGLQKLPLQKAALMIALSETASCIGQLGDVTGKTVLVTGTGIAGYTLAYFAKAFGAARVIVLGRRASRLEPARALGADETYVGGTPEWDRRRQLRDADFVLEATGNAWIFADGVPLLREGGLVAFYGVSETPYTFGDSQGVHTITFTPKEAACYEQVCRLLQTDERLTQVLLTHRWGFSQIEEAFAQVNAGEVIKGMVVMGE